MISIIGGMGVMIGLGIVTNSIYNWIITVNGGIPSYGIWDESSNHDSKIWPWLSIIPSIIHMGGWDCWLEFTLFGKVSINENIKYPQFVFNIFIWGGACWGRNYSQTGSGSITIVTYLRKISSGTSKFSWKIPRFQLILRGPGLLSHYHLQNSRRKTYKNLSKTYQNTIQLIFPSCHLQWIGLREN